MDPRFSYPIPGQSLTDTPKNGPWENPPEIIDAEEALQMHIDRLNDPDKIMSMVKVIEAGVDIASLTEAITRGAVMAGVHTVDVSLIIAPSIHEFIRTHMEVLSIPYDDGFESRGDKAEKYAGMGKANMVASMRSAKSSGPAPAPTQAEMQDTVAGDLDPAAETFGGGGMMERRV